MKRIFILLLFALASCSKDIAPQPAAEPKKCFECMVAVYMDDRLSRVTYNEVCNITASQAREIEKRGRFKENVPNGPYASSTKETYTACQVK